MKMNDGISGAAGWAFIKIYGLKAVLGMIGAALLYLVFPPMDKDGRLNRREFFVRLVCAGVASELFGDWVVQLLIEHAPWLHAGDHRGAIYLMVGAPAWMVGRWVAIALQKRRNKGIDEVYQEAKDKL